MTLISKAMRERLQQEFDRIQGDTVRLKLHDGDPGPDFTDNLVGGDGTPIDYTFGSGEVVTFKTPFQHLRSGWLPCRRGSGQGAVREYVVSMWAGDMPIAPIASVVLVSGGTITVTQVDRMRLN